MSSEEMKSNVEALARLTTCLEEARDELERLNEEETLFEWEVSDFPQLQQMFTMKEPYEKLWNTAWNFTQKNEIWINGNNYFRAVLHSDCRVSNSWFFLSHPSFDVFYFNLSLSLYFNLLSSISRERNGITFSLFSYFRSFQRLECRNNWPGGVRNVADHVQANKEFHWAARPTTHSRKHKIQDWQVQKSPAHFAHYLQSWHTW